MIQEQSPYRASRVRSESQAWLGLPNSFRSGLQGNLEGSYYDSLLNELVSLQHRV